jgi:hypothetical protein
LNNPISNIDLHGDSTIRGGGFLKNTWQGVKDGASSTLDFAKSLGTSQGWVNLASGFNSLTQPGSPGQIALGQSVYNGLSNIPNMNGDDWGHALGFGTEKLGEAILLSKGAGFAKSAFTSTADMSEISTLYHSTSSARAASSILSDGINPSFFNPASRFGGGFYMSNDIATSFAEITAHGANPANTIQFTSQGGSFLNATSPVLSLGVKYAPNLMSGAARGLGYDGIMYNSLRGTGVNVVQFKNFGTLTNGTLFK